MKKPCAAIKDCKLKKIAGCEDCAWYKKSIKKKG